MKFFRVITIASLAGLGCLSQAQEDPWFYAIIPGTSGTSGIYKIDTTTATFGEATLLYSGASGQSVGNGANALAFDYDTSTFYWTNSSGGLDSWATSSLPTAAYVNQSVGGGGLVSTIYDNATYFNNTYIYDKPTNSAPGQAYSVDLTSLGQTNQNVTGLAVPGYGDVAYDKKNGDIYAFGAGGEQYKFKYDPTATMTATALGPNGYTRDLQIAFDSNNNLYGIYGPTGDIYEINKTSGVETLKSASIHTPGGAPLTGWIDAANGFKPSSTPEPFTIGLGIAGLGVAVRRMRAKAKGGK